MIDVSAKDTKDVRRAVRLVFTLDGIVGREDIVVSAGSVPGAIAAAGLAFGQSLLWETLLEHQEAGEDAELATPSLYISRIQVGEALRGFDGVRDLLRRQGRCHEDDAIEAYRRIAGDKPRFDPEDGYWLHARGFLAQGPRLKAAAELLNLLDGVAPDGPWEMRREDDDDA